MNIGHIAIAPVFPLWLIILLFCFGIAAAFAQYVITRDKLGKKRAMTLALLRLSAITLVVACALNPSVMAKKGHRISPAIAVLVDTSQSMGQSVASGKGTRLDEARAMMTEGATPLLQFLREKFDVNVYELADTLKPLETGELAHLTAAGNRRDLNQALKALSGKNSVALLVSDGNVQWHEGQTPQLPIIAVPLGTQTTYRDILIKEIKISALAFRDREITLDVTIKSYGYRGLTLPVLLKKSGTLLTAKSIRFPSDSGETTASLSFVPDEVGRQQLSISIPQQAGEHSTINNQIDFSLKVVRDKTRILMVSGSPSMNYRFLRMALKSDPSIDLLSFVILRTPSDILNVPMNEQSLIPFPVETLFTKELNSFDLVIFDNFDYSPYLRPDYRENLRKFVREGGGFALIGGPNLFNEGRDGSSPLGDMLPLRFAGKEFYRRDAPVRVRLTRAGTTHPLMQTSDNFREGAKDRPSFWQEMPPLDGINLTDAKRSSTVLIESADSIPWPILTVSEYGKGRVLALATDYAWKWYMAMAAKGEGNQPYLGLIHRMTRWLTKDPSLDPVHIILPETAPSTGQEVIVRIQSQVEDPSRQPNTIVSFAVFNPAGEKITSNLKSTPQPGEHLLSFLPEKSGTYRIKVETPLAHMEESMIIAGPLDRLDAAPDHDLLKRIAAMTGGEYVSPRGDLPQVLKRYSQKREKQFIGEVHSQLWATPVVMAIILVLLSSEWYFRRRWGLI